MSATKKLQIFKNQLDLRRRAKNGALVLMIAMIAAIFSPDQASAGCAGCTVGDTAATQVMIIAAHASGEGSIMGKLDAAFRTHQNFLADTFFIDSIKPALQEFTRQMSAIATQQAFMIGTFFDAKQQMEAQRLHQELQVQAHKDYQPSKEFCYFGTNVRSMAASEEISDFNALAINNMQMKRHLGNGGMAASAKQDKVSRWEQFKTTYCDVNDNSWPNAEEGETGLSKVCGGGAADKERVNRDIDYTQLIDQPRTVDVAFYEKKDSPTPEEEDILALGKNLFGHDVLTRMPSNFLAEPENQKLYYALRSVAAKRNVAENSFNAIVGLKASGSKSGAEGNEASETRRFLAAVMQELGVPSDEIYQMIGNDPSYYAQLEILAKKIYQTPNFFAGLYDKPANVQRKGVALKAVELMLDRAIYESQLRQEMAMSVMLSAKIQPQLETISTALEGAN